MRRLALQIEYDGTDFRGFQLQPDVRTVQGVLEDAVQEVTQVHSRVQGGSRTDAGAHAEGQVAHFDTDSDVPCAQFVHALNYYLPADVAVRDAAQVDPDFDSCSWARSKLYRYRVLPSPVPRPLRRRRVCRTHYRMDLGALRRCADIARGTRNFASFGSEVEQYESTERTLTRSEWCSRGDELHYMVEGTGFLYKMVRALVGTMLEVGRHKADPGDFERMFRARDRREAGPTAPAHGLSLIRLHYEPPLFGPQGR